MPQVFKVPIPDTLFQEDWEEDRHSLKPQQHGQQGSYRWC